MGLLNSLLCLDAFAEITNFASFIDWLDSVVWGPLMLILIVGTGVFLTFRLKFLPWRNLGYALKSIFAKKDDKKAGDISPFQSLMTALSATVGVGNIAGVATAIAAGGPGALLWMWLTAIVGLSTKYAESLIAVKYRTVNDKGEMAGGAMFALRDGLKSKGLGKVLAFLFALFGVIASFGIGNMTQSNTVSSSIAALPCFSGLTKFTLFGVDLTAANIVTGVIIVVLCMIVIVGGIKSIGRVTGKIVPFMAALYFIVAIIAILINIKNIPSGLYNIFVGAFAPQAIMGGVLGNIIATAIQKGVARGVFSNEAGLGSAPIAAAAAKTDHPARQGYVNMTGTFIDTIIICSLTGLVIASSGVLYDAATGAYTTLTGAELTATAFAEVFGGSFGHYFIALSVLLFGFSTILGWAYYGEKCLEYLAGGTKINMAYRVLFSLLPIVGACSSLTVAWNISDIFNALMAVPNLIGLLLLSNVIAKETDDFQINYLVPERNAAKAKKNK
ncbi:MAG: alanine/glycine:cation symporter family protein [Bacillota bacterium]|jgi:AGCS family alanine or glycine:cation symporter